MIAQKQVTKRTSTGQTTAMKPMMNLKGVIGGVVFSFILLIVMLLILTGVYFTTTMNFNTMGNFVTGIMVFCITIGSLKSAKKVTKNGWLHGVLVSLLFLLILLVFGFIFVDGFSLHNGVMIKAVFVLLGGILGGMLGYGRG